MQKVNRFNKIRHVNESPRNKLTDRYNSTGLLFAIYLLLYLLQAGCAHCSASGGKHNKEAESAHITSEAKLDKATIHYRENGTPSLIKGDNLSYSLDGDPGFQKLKKENLYMEIVYRFLESQRTLLKLDDPRSELKKTRLTIDDMQFKHVKVKQMVNDVPIWGREVIIHLNRDNEVYMVNGNIEQSAKFDTTPKLTNREAAKHAMKALPGGIEGWHVAGSEIQVFFTKPGAPRLVYVVTLVKGLANREYYFIDAKDGTFLHKVSGTPSQNQKSAPGYRR